MLTLIADGPAETVGDTVVLGFQATLLDHFILYTDDNPFVRYSFIARWKSGKAWGIREMIIPGSG